MSFISLLFFGFVLVLTEKFGACNFLRKKEADAIEKRSINPNGGITLNFQHGMRDFLVNGKGISYQKPVVAFQTMYTLGNLGPNYAHGVIKFNSVSVNIGNGYSASTGKFTAPIGGVYQFSLSYLQLNGYTSHVWMMKDNTQVSELHANHKTYDQLAKTILVTLQKGETFWIQLVKNAAYAIHGTGKYTVFGGHLISV